MQDFIFLYTCACVIYLLPPLICAAWRKETTSSCPHVAPTSVTGGVLAHFTHNRAQDVGTATQLRSSVLRPAAANTNADRLNAGGAKQVKLDVITWWKKEAQVDWARVSPSERQQWRDARWDMIETQVVDTIDPNFPSSSLCAPSLLAFHASKMTNEIFHACRGKLNCHGGSSI